jgi:hypothetical protein
MQTPIVGCVSPLETKKPLKQRLESINWWKGWDSNPRKSFDFAGFQDQCLKPLGHPSSSMPLRASEDTGPQAFSAMPSPLATAGAVRPIRGSFAARGGRGRVDTGSSTGGKLDGSMTKDSVTMSSSFTGRGLMRGSFDTRPTTRSRLTGAAAATTAAFAGLAGAAAARGGSGAA